MLEIKIERSIVSMSKRGKMVTCLVLALVMVVSCVPLFASANDRVIGIPENRAWTKAYDAGLHETGYSSAAARCNSVYPKDGGIDLYSQINCKVENTYGAMISDRVYILSEINTKDTEIMLKQGMQDPGNVYFRFQGANTMAANASVSYYATYYG